eukprot:78405-Pyramimonas_sp.AAC.1
MSELRSSKVPGPPTVAMLALEPAPSHAGPPGEADAPHAVPAAWLGIAASRLLMLRVTDT